MQIRFADRQPDGDFALVLLAAGADAESVRNLEGLRETGTPLGATIPVRSGEANASRQVCSGHRALNVPSRDGSGEVSNARRC